MVLRNNLLKELKTSVAIAEKLRKQIRVWGMILSNFSPSIGGYKTDLPEEQNKK